MFAYQIAGLLIIPLHYPSIYRPYVVENSVMKVGTDRWRSRGRLFPATRSQDQRTEWCHLPHRLRILVATDYLKVFHVYCQAPHCYSHEFGGLFNYFKARRTTNFNLQLDKVTR